MVVHHRAYTLQGLGVVFTHLGCKEADKDKQKMNFEQGKKCIQLSIAAYEKEVAINNRVKCYSALSVS